MAPVLLWIGIYDNILQFYNKKDPKGMQVGKWWSLNEVNCGLILSTNWGRDKMDTIFRTTF